MSKIKDNGKNSFVFYDSFLYAVISKDFLRNRKFYIPLS